MRVMETNRRDMEVKLKSMGDYVKIEYLSFALKAQLDFETRKFVLNTLSKIYNERGMFGEAAKLMRISADINTTFDGKVNDFMKSFDLYLKAGVFDEAEVSFAKALALASQVQKVEIKIKRKQAYKAQAKDLMVKDKRKQAMLVYEKLLSMELDPLEKKDVQQNLMNLYEKLGKVREFYNLKRTV